MVIPPEVRPALVEHAEAERPNEACGIVLFRDGVADRYVPVANAAGRPYRSEVRAEREAWFLEDEGYELAVFHSHPASPARPSRTDVENIGLWEARLYLILSLQTKELAAFRIEDGQIGEEEIA